MIRALKDFLENALGEPGDAEREGPSRVELAAAVLMVEISLADSRLQDEERRVIENALTRQFHLSPEDASEMIAAAEREVDHAVSLHDFTRMINEHLDMQEKIRIVERLWEVAFADAVLDKYEEYYIRKIADLLYVPHVQFVKTRHRASRGGG
jgi:uncharacterized tellurite resistance protein B-like protein